MTLETRATATQVREFQRRLAAAEKRAEELQADLNAEIVAHVATAKERDSSQASLLRVEERLRLIVKECDLALEGRLTPQFYILNVRAMCNSALSPHTEK